MKRILDLLFEYKIAYCWSILYSITTLLFSFFSGLNENIIDSYFNIILLPGVQLIATFSTTDPNIGLYLFSLFISIIYWPLLVSISKKYTTFRLCTTISMLLFPFLIWTYNIFFTSNISNKHISLDYIIIFQIILYALWQIYLIIYLMLFSRKLNQ